MLDKSLIVVFPYLCQGKVRAAVSTMLLWVHSCVWVFRRECWQKPHFRTDLSDNHIYPLYCTLCYCIQFEGSWKNMPRFVLCKSVAASLWSRFCFDVQWSSIQPGVTKWSARAGETVSTTITPTVAEVGAEPWIPGWLSWWLPCAGLIFECISVMLQF